MMGDTRIPAADGVWTIRRRRSGETGKCRSRAVVEDLSRGLTGMRPESPGFDRRRLPLLLLLLMGLFHLAPIPAGPNSAWAGDSEALQWGGEIRLRAEALKNARDLYDRADDEYAFYRMRYRLWADARPRDGLRLYLRLGNEYRWGSYAGALRGDAVYDMASLRDSESRVSLDNGFAEIRAARDLYFTFGRMDLMYGEGFLVFDGTPADGSSSSYFDALKLTWARGPVTVDLFTAKIMDDAFGTPASDEDLYGIYARRKQADVYLLYRDKEGETSSGSGIVHPKQSTVALGARYAHLPENGIHYAAEAAVQTGKHGRGPDDSGKGDPDRQAYGGYIRGGWTGSSRPGFGFELGGVILSGDDPSTHDYEGWDGFYSEWPKYSDLYIYTIYDNTTQIRGWSQSAPVVDDEGSWTNLAAAWVEMRFLSCRPATLVSRATWLEALEKTGTGTGKERGLVIMARLDVRPAPGVTVQVLGEGFAPGDFYFKEADHAYYGRIQVTAGF